MFKLMHPSMSSSTHPRLGNDGARWRFVQIKPQNPQNFASNLLEAPTNPLHLAVFMW